MTFSTALAGRRSKWAMILLWVVVAVALAPLGSKLTSVEKNDEQAYLPAQAESTKVATEIKRFLGNTVPTAVVYERRAGITAADRAAVAEDRRLLAVEVLPPGAPPPQVAPSRDGQALLLQLDVPASQNADVLTAKIRKVRDIADAGSGGLDVKVAGAGGQLLDSLSAFQGIDSTLLFATVGVVALILLITYRSPTLWLVPLITVGVASQVAQGLIYLLAKHGGLTVSGQSQGILTVLVFGAGTDYALLLIARYREELHRHDDRHEAMALALHRAGPAILASAATVIASLLCLLLARLNSDRGLGPVCAIGIGVALLAQLTLLPALLVAGGRWLFWPFVPRFGTPTREERSVWGRAGAAIARHPRRTWGIAAVVLVLLSLGLGQLNATGLTTAQSFRGTPDSVAGQAVITGHYSAGASDPAFVLANAGTADAVRAAAAGTPGVAGVVVAGPPKNGRALVLATLAEPPDSADARDTIDRLRDRVHAVPDAAARVGGTTAVSLDVLRASAYDRNLLIPVVLVVVLVVLTLLLRALVAPLVLIVTVILSFTAALGASALVFRHLFGFAGADPATPLYAFIFLVALGIDYNIFLMTRVREESQRVGTHAGTLRALAVTGGVITSAGVVLAATFSVLAVLPLVTLTEIGFIVAFGVLLDTLVVRSVVVPALTLDLGSRVWWPSALQRAAAALDARRRPSAALPPQRVSPPAEPAREA